MPRTCTKLTNVDVSVDPHRPLHDEYTRLLRVQRKVKLESDDGVRLCTCCGKAHLDHINDDRCSVYATSGTFVDKDKKLIELLEDTISNVERLLDV